MQFDEFMSTLSAGDCPPSGVSELLQALWYDARGDWDRAHRITQEIGTEEASRVHAYLHRKEGDLGNARYWYAQAGRPESRAALAQEWEELVRHLLRAGSHHSHGTHQ